MVDIVVSAPGKVILHGEHSVVYGKVAVASSLNLRCFLRATVRDGKDESDDNVGDDDNLVLDLPDVGILRKWKTSNVQSGLLPSLDLNFESDGSPSPPSERSLQTLKQFAGISSESTDTRDLAVISFLYLYCCVCHQHRKPPQARFRLISQLPVGAGLGSSAAFSVCLAAVLLQTSGRISSLVSIDDNLKESLDSGCQGDSNPKHKRFQCWSAKERELINTWAFIGEKIIHGQPSGIDNSVSTLGGAIHFQNRLVEPVSKMPSLKILLTNTKIPRSTKTLVANVRKRHDKFTEVMKPLLESLDGVTERSLKAYSALYDQPSCVAAFSELEELIDMNQHLLNAIGVGHPSLDTVVQVTARHSLSSKLTGAGGGGCAYTLLTPGTSPEVIEAARQELRQHGFDCWETSVGAKGVTFHPDPRNDNSVPPELFQ